MKRAAIAVAIAIAAVAAWIWLGPVPAGLLDARSHASLRLTDRNGVVLFETLGRSGDRGEWLEANALPSKIADATIAAEDRRFNRHHGVDPIAVSRALVHDLRAMKVVEGGSTITQQVAKLLLDEREGRSAGRSVIRKVREAMLAVRIERRMSKSQVLALYLNLAPYGNRIRGAARASRTYFGVDATELTDAQAAFLASLPQRPGAFNPLRDPNAATVRQRGILRRMHREGMIDDPRLRIAMAEKLTFGSAASPVVAQHFVERVLASLPEDTAPSGNRVIATTLDAGLQREVAGIISAQRPSLIRHGAHSVAVAVLDNATGEWLAWEGSGDYFGTNFGGAIDGVTTPRQPGSALKPFTYATSFEQGSSPATILPDIPSHFPTAEEGIVYTPRNYDGRFRGPLTVRNALASSQNVPAVAMLSKVGPPALLRLLRQSGFDTLDRTADYYGLGLTLGDAEVTLERMIGAYAAFARGGVHVDPVMRRAARVESRERRIMSQRTAFWIADILADDRAREYAFGEGSNLEFPFTVAVKTGTSQAYRDNWTIGFTRDVTVGVWVGNFDRGELRNSSGVTGAAPIFRSVMLAAVKRARGSLPIGDDAPVVAPPANVERVQICTLSGLRPSPSCPARASEWLPSDRAPEFCSWHHEGSTDWPPEYRTWARSAGLLEGTSVPVAAKIASAHPNERVRVTNPPDGATFMIDPTLRRDFQALRLRAVARGTVTWRVDQRLLGSAPSDRHLEWKLAPGRHEISATDGTGGTDRVVIWVK
jgi:penicillin-binding protein 1C